MLGICNGFQILCESGLLPGALIRNRSLRFVCRDVHVRVETSQTPVTTDLTPGEVLEIPVKHGEGQFVADARAAGRIEDEGLVVFRYARRDGTVDDAHNPNGGANHIAGVRNAAGNVVGLMPHPEHAVDPDVGPTGGQPLFASLLTPALAEGRGNVAVVEEPLHRALGLTDDELERIVETLGREPEPHRARDVRRRCGPSTARTSPRRSTCGRCRPRASAVLVGPGQDAGAVDVGDGVAAVFKMESHSHPSAIEPYQGAATGVGGIVRDIISMGARPVALLDPLMFGPLTDERNRWLLGGVVAGIGGYGNCIGVPTVGGEIHFAEPHSANPSVNVMCVGIAPRDGLVTSASHTPHAGSFMVLYGATTGRDGIGGVSRAGERHARGGRRGVAAARADRRPVRGEAPDRGVARADRARAARRAAGSGRRRHHVRGQRVGRARGDGRASSTWTPCRCASAAMEPFEILTSESQERMLAIVAPGRLEDVRAVCETLGPGDRGDRDARGGRRAHDPARGGGGRAGAGALARRRRPRVRPTDRAGGRRRDAEDPTFVPFEGDLRDAFLAVLASPNVASKRWVFEQYDSLVQGQTVAAAGSDAAVVRVPGTLKGLALSSDGKGRFGALDPYLGAAHAVAEAARNVAVTGARPLAITNCLNFGNPERPAVMWQFAEAIRGMRDACLAFETPVTGGNVSFYNESGDSAIWPTPVIGMLGLLEDYRLRVPTGFPRAGLPSASWGRRSPSWAARSSPRWCWAWWPGGHRRWTWNASARSTSCCTRRRATTCWRARTTAATAAWRWRSPRGHRAGTGSSSRCRATSGARRAVLRVGVARRGGRGAERDEELAELAAARGVPFAAVGETGGPRVVFDGLFETTVDELRDVYEGAIPRLLGEPTRDPGGHVRLLGDARLRRRGHRRGGGRDHARAAAPRWSEILAAAGPRSIATRSTQAFDPNWEVFHESWGPTSSTGRRGDTADLRPPGRRPVARGARGAGRVVRRGRARGAAPAGARGRGLRRR